MEKLVTLYSGIYRRVSSYRASYAIAALIVFCSLQINPASAATLKTRVTGAANWGTASTWIQLRTGTINANVGGTVVNGTGTLFTTELAVGSVLVSDANGAEIGTVQSISSNTQLTLVAGATVAVAGGAYGREAVPAAADAVQIGNININAAAVAVTLNVTPVTITSLTFIAHGLANTLTHTTTNALTVTGAVTFNQPTSAVTANWLINAGTATAGSVTFNGSVTTATNISRITLTTGTLNISGNLTYNAVVGGSAATAVVAMTSTGNLNIGGSLLMTTGGVGTLSPGTTSTVTFNGSGAQTITDGSSISYNNLTINKTAGAATLATASVITGNFTITAGTFSTGGFALTVPKNFSNNGTFTAGAGTVTLNGTTAQVISGTSATTFNNLTVTNTTAAVSVSSNINVSGTLTMSGAASVLTPAAAVVINNAAAAGTLTGTGTVQVTRTAATADFANQYKFTTNTLTNLTVDYAGAGAQSVNAYTYGSLKLSGSGTKTAAGALTVNTTLNISAGLVLDMAANALAGTLTSVAGTGKLKTQNTTATPLPAGKTWTCNVEYNNAAGGQSVVAATYADLINTNTSGSNIATGTVSVSGILTLNTSSVLDMGSNVLGGTISSVAGAGTLRTQNTSAAPIPAGESWSGTVDYNNAIGGQSIVAGSYTILNNSNNSGTNTATGILNISSAFNSASAGGFAAGAFSHTLAGNWNMPSGAFSSTGTITLNGAGAQTILAPAAFFNLTVNKASGSTTLLSDVTVSGTLTFTLGNVTTGSYILIIPNGGAITGAGSSTGWVVGRLQKYFAGTTNTFEVGSSLYYTPVSSTLTGISQQGSLILSTASAYHPSIAASLINSSRNILRYWSVAIPGSGYAIATSSDWTFNWNLADNYSPITPATESVAWYNTLAGTWNYPTVSGTPTTTSISVTGVNSIGDFTVGEVCNAFFSYTGSPYCSTSGTASITLGAGSALGTFSATPAGLSLNTSTGDITLGTSTAGSYTVTNTLSGGCASHPQSAAVTVTTPPSATISYSGSPYSAVAGTSSVTLTGTAGGIYTSTPGLTIDSLSGNITPATSTAGTYTVTYTVPAASGCGQFTTTASVTILSPTLFRSVASGTWNVAATWESSTDGGTVWSAAPVAPSTAFDSVTISAGHTVTVTASISPKLLSVAATGILLPNATALISGSGTLTGTGTVKVVMPTTGFATQYTITTKDITGLTVDYAATGAQSVDALTYSGLSLSGSGTKTAAGNIVVNSTLTVASGITFALAANTLAGTLATIANSGIISTQNTTATPIPVGKTWGGTVSYTTAAGGQTIVAGTYSGLTNSNTSGTNTAGGALVVNGVLTLSASSVLDMGTNALSGTLTSTSGTGRLKTQNTTATPVPTGKTWAGTIEYNNAVGSQTVMAGTYAGLAISNTSGTNTASGNITVNTTLTLNVSSVFNMNTFTLAGTLTTITGTGILRTQSSSATPITTGKTWSGTVEFYRPAGAQTIPAGTYNNLTNSNTSGTNTAAGAITINGTLTLNTASVLSMAANALAGTLTSITGTGTLKTQNTTATPIPVGKTWPGTVEYFNAAGTQTVVAGTYNNLTNTNTTGTNTAGGALVVNGTLTLNTLSVLDMAANTLSGTLIGISGIGILKTQDITAAPIPAAKTWPGTVIYNAATGGQSIMGGSYGYLTTSITSGTNTAIGAATVVNDFIASGGTFAGGAFTHSVGGNWSMTGATFTNTGTTVTFNGTGAQTISSSGSFRNLVVNKASGSTTLLGNVAIDGTLTFTLGTITTGANTLILSAGASISGAAQSTGWVNGNLQKYFSGTTGTFDIGGPSYYSPINVTLASLTTPGSLVGSATIAYHPAIGTSMITSGRNINRYWTLSYPGAGAAAFTSATLTFNWNVVDNYSPITAAIERVAQYSAATWSYPVVSGTPTTSSITVTGVTSIGDFTVGEVMTRHYVNNNSTVGDGYTSAVGNDANPGTAALPFLTISKAVAVSSSGDSIYVDAGTYDEQVAIDKGVFINGLNGIQSIATFTGSVGTNLKTVFKVAAQNVTIRNMGFSVPLNIVHSAIHTTGNTSHLQILNNIITAGATSATGFQAYGLRNAIAVNPALSTTGYTQYAAGTGVQDIKCSGNTIKGSTTAQNGFADADFRAGFAADNSATIVVGGIASEGNTINTINHDVIIRAFQTGDVTVRNNTFNGGGVEMSATATNSGTITIDSNSFSYSSNTAPAFALLRLLSNSGSRTTLVKNNTFTNHNWYASVENYNTVTFDGNTFTPAIKVPGVPASNKFRHIDINTKLIQSGATAKVTMGATFINNTFNGYAGVDGKALVFYNHDSTGALFGTYTVGQAGSENTFNSNISNYIFIDSSNGQAANSMPAYPEYSGMSASTTGYWKNDITATENKFDVGAVSPLRPDAMTNAQLATLDGFIFDKKDNPNVGRVFGGSGFKYYVNDNAQTGDVYTSAIGNDANSGSIAAPFLTINKAISVAAAGDTVYVDAGSYSEQVNANKKITILGSNASISPNTGTRNTESILNNPTGNGITVTTTSRVVIKGFRITTPVSSSVSVNTANNKLTLEKMFFDGCKGLSIFTSDTLFIVDNRFNALTSAEGAFLQGNYNGTTGTYVQIYNNVWLNSLATGINLSSSQGDIYNNTMTGIAYYGILVANYCNLNITRNTFNAIANPDTTVNTYGAGVRFYTPSAGMSCNVTNNYFTGNYIGVSVRSPGGALAGTNISVYNNYFSGNTFAHINHTGTGNLSATCNWYGSSDSSTVSPKIMGIVTWLPLLTSGLDSDAVTAGFQPYVNTCATPITWTGNTSTAWNTSTNWSTSTIPASTNYVVIPTSPVGGRMPTISANVAAINSLSIQSGATLTHTGGTINTQSGTSISGTYAQSGGVYLAGSTVTVNSGGIINESGSGNLHLDYVVGTNSTQSLALASGAAVNILGGTIQVKDLTISTGSAITQSGGTVQLTRDYINNGGTFTASAGTIEWMGTTPGTPVLSGTNQFYNYLVDPSANPGFLSSGSFSVGGNFTSTTYTIPGGVTTTLNGTGTQQITGVNSAAGTFGNLVINKASGTAILLSNANVAGDITFSAGTFDLSTFTCNRITAGGTFSMSGTAWLRLAGASGGQAGSNTPYNFSAGGAAATTTIEYYGSNAVTQTIFPLAPYGNLLLTNGSGTGTASKITAGSVTVYGTLTVGAGVTLTPAAADLVGGTGTLTGTGTVQVTRTAATADFVSQYTITNKTLTGLTVDYSSTGAQSINALNYFNLTTSGARGANSITLAGAGTIGVSGTFSPSATFTTGGNIITGSTVSFNGSGAQSIPAFTYNNLTIGSTGTKTASGILNIAGNFSLSTGTFAGGAYTHTVGGNWSMTGGSFTNTGTTITLNGTSAQTISSTGSFNNLTVNKAAGSTTLLSNTTVGGVLTFTLGTITTGTNTLILTNGASVSGAGQSTGWVFGNLQKYFSGTTGIFDIGCQNYYSPVGVSLASLTTPGSLIASATNGYHPNLGASTISSSRDINRYWTLAYPGAGALAFTTASLTFNWNAADNYAGITPALERVGQYSAATWAYPTISGTPTTTSITTTGISAIGDFTVGESCSAAFSYTSSPYCSNGSNPSVTLGAGATAGAFTASPAGLTLNGSTGAITLSTSTPGTYTVTNTLSGNCVMSSTTSVTVTAAPSATISYLGSPYCTSAGTGTVTRTGTAGGTYTASPAGLTINSVSGDITTATSTVGTYTVTYTVAAAGGCAQYQATTSVTISAPSAATISYAGTPFCTSGAISSVTRTGTAGGTYTASPAGLSINASTGDITPSTSTPGSYTVTYTMVNGGCTNTATTSVTITAQPAATISYAASPFCQSTATGTVTRTGTAGGTYTASPAGLSIASGTGTITPGTSTPGTYTVTYTVAAAGGCGQFTTTASVTITATPSATISYTGTPYCTSAGVASVVRTGTAGGTYTASPAGLSINSTTGDITPTSSTAGTYTVTYTVAAAGGCSQYTTTTSVTISAPLAATISYPGSPFCSSTGTGLVTRTGAAGGTYSAPAGLTINAASGDITTSTSVPGTYTVTYTMVNGGCTTTATTSVTITTAPSAAISYAGTPFCQSTATGTVTQTGTAGGTYTASPAGLTISAANGTITPGTSSPGTYTVTYTIGAAGGCSQYTTTASVTITATPAASISYSGSPYCTSAGTATATRTGTAGGTYTAAPAGLTINAASGDITTATSTPGTYTVTYTVSASGGCGQYQTITTVTISSPSSATISYAGTPFCTNAGTGVVTRTGTAGGTYTAPAGLSINSSTGDIAPASSTPGTYTVTYTMVNGGCTNTATCSVTVTAAPSATISYTGTPYCSSAGTATVTRTGTAGGTYTASPAGLAINSATGTITLASSTAGTYTVTYTVAATGGCGQITTTASVTVTTQPFANGSYPGSPYCANAGTIYPTGTAVGAPGTISSSAGLSVDANGIVNPATSTPGTYNVIYTVPASGGCSLYTTSTSITITAVPSAAISYAGSPYCTSGGTASVTRTGTAGGTYTASPAGLTLNSGTGAITLASTTPGTYTVTYTIAASGGCAQFTSTANVTVANPGTWTGTAGTAWFAPANWYCGAVPTTTTNVTIPTGLTNYPLIDTGAGTVQNITVQSGASLNVNGGTIKISGAVSNAGIINVSNGRVEMNGSSAQSIPASVFASNTIKDLTINNAAGVTLNGALKVTGVLKAATGTFNTGGYITLASDATGTALIDGAGAGSVLGNVTMQRYLATGFGYKYISSPHQAALVSQLSNDINLTAAFPTLYSYDEDRTSSGWVNYTDSTGTLAPLHGYAANFGTSSAPKTLDITGVVNNGSVSYSLYNHNRTYTQGFNLVGNPYPSPIDWNAASGWTRTNVDNAVYYFNAGTTNQYTGTYSSYINGISSDGIANNIIPAMQGFFVHVTNGSYPVAGSLGLNNNVRINNLNPVFHKGAGANDDPLFRISARFSDETISSDPAVVYFNGAASSAYDIELDALKMMNTDERVPNLYARSSDGVNLSINAIPDPGDSVVIMPLQMDADRDGTVVFRALDIQRMPYGMHIYLSDAQLGKSQELQSNSEYSVDVTKGKYENRFFLGFTRKESVNLPGISDQLTAYYTQGSIFVYAIEAKGTVVVTNAIGQVVRREELTGTGFHELKMIEVSNGVYVVTLYTENGKKSKKMLVSQ